ncbi:monocarboxylate transporter 5-like isoform X2 [Limulus polyphemus]|uniref:Monocarboxylate transporter 5-like isoform X2 n=1 Tax=Limulus polyphemus TaxID=6850 RepID=A0ABM1RUU2_LIMPO|nr:monocarboxylate transporter 5-like isoform X2 [Limulus polyphemus]
MDDLQIRIMSKTKNRNNIAEGASKNPLLPFRNVPPDGGWGWMVMLGIVLNNVFIMGQVKSSGVYLTMLMDEYKANPSRVSWVTSLQYTLINVLGPLWSATAEIMDVRMIMIFAAIVHSAGLVSSCYGPNVEFLFFSLGILGGISCGICYFSGVVMVTKYFEKRRTFANGLGLGATALGGIVIPLLLEGLVSEYGVRGTLLIMGALMLHGIVGAMLWEPVERHLKREKIFIADTCSKGDLRKFIGPRHSDPLINSTFQRELKDMSNQIKITENAEQEENNSLIVDCLPLRRFTIDNVDLSLLSKEMESNTRLKTRDYQPTMFTSMIDLGGTVGTINSEKLKTKGLEFFFLHYKNLFDLSLFSSLQWYLLTTTFVLTLTGYPGTHIFLPLRARYAGLSSEQASFLLSVMSATDTTARIAFSWLADRNFCPRRYWYIGGVMSAGTACIAFVFTNTYLSMLVTSCLAGSASGCYLPLLLPIFGEEFGSKRLATAYSLSALFAGLVVLGTIPFLGYLVDITGSTTLCYSVLGACLLTAGSFVFLSQLLSTKNGNLNKL